MSDSNSTPIPSSSSKPDTFLIQFSILQLRDIVKNAHLAKKHLDEKFAKLDATLLAVDIQILTEANLELDKQLKHPLAPKLENYLDILKEYCHNDILLCIYKQLISRLATAEIARRGYNPTPGFSSEEHKSKINNTIHPSTQFSNYIY